MKWRKVITWALFLLVIGFFTFWWTMGPEPMREATSYSVNDPAMKVRVLIASQGSAFKDALVGSIISEFKADPVFLQVIDISGLEQVAAEEWSVIVILHSIEYWRPQQVVTDFMDKPDALEKVVLLSTSGEGTSVMEGVDGISSASRLSEVPEKTREIVRRIRAIVTTNQNEILDNTNSNI